MVKKKTLDLETEEKEKIKEQLEEDDEIIELEEVLEEPEELPVGEDLDELLFSEDGEADIGDIDLESLDATLGLDESEKEESEVITKMEAVEAEQPSAPTQEDIDALFEEESSVEEIAQEAAAEESADIEPISEEKPSVSESLEDAHLDEIVAELENRIAQKIEELIEQRLPELVLKTVREELQSIQREFERNNQ